MRVRLSRRCLLETWADASAIRSVRGPDGVAPKVPAAGLAARFVRRASRQGFAMEWLKRGSSTNSRNQGCPPRFHHDQGGTMEW